MTELLAGALSRFLSPRTPRSPVRVFLARGASSVVVAYAGAAARSAGPLIRRELLMTSSHASNPQVMARPACTPAAIRAVLAANADPEVLRRYDDELDTAFRAGSRARRPRAPCWRRSGAGGSRPTPGATPTPTACSWPASSDTSVKGHHPSQNAVAGMRSEQNTVSDTCIAGISTTPARRALRHPELSRPGRVGGFHERGCSGRPHRISAPSWRAH